MIDRRTGPAVLLLLLLAAALEGCLPETGRTGPGVAPGVSPAAPTPTPGPTDPTPLPSFVRPTPTPLPPFTTYVVKRGDTLTSIAKRFKTDARSIAYWNRARYKGLDPESPRYRPDNIKVGWTLKILRGQAYVPPEDDGESGEQYTPPPDDLDPEEPTTSPSPSG
jgi:hypothetical protein